MSEQRGQTLVTWRRRLIDPLLFSSVWMALAASALTLAASGAMLIPVSLAAPGLVFFGILLVYNLDRLRDVERDRATSPERSHFIESHRRALWALTVSSALGASCILWTAPPRVWVIALGTLGLGFGHRRLKELPYLKESYLTVAWLAGIVGLPLAFQGDGANPLWTLAALAPPLLANDLGASARDREGLALILGPARALGLGKGLALVGIGVCLVAPAPVRPLVVVSFATGASLFAFRPSELYGFLVIDGALLLGGVAAWLLGSMS